LGVGCACPCHVACACEVHWDKPCEPDPDKTKWLLMVYMAATAPNLQEPLGLDLRELNESLRVFGDRADCVDVVVQVDTPTNVSKVFKLNPDDDMPSLIAVHPTQVSCTLKCFVKKASEHYDGYCRGLVVWGHASGIGRGFEAARLSPSSQPGFAQAGAVPDAAQAPGRASQQVAQAGAVWTQLGELRCKYRPHLVGFDACYMGSAEVVAQLGRSVDYLLAPQADIALEGWHYDLLLDNIVARSGKLSPEELGLAVVKQVGLSESSPDGITFFNLKYAQRLVKALRLIVASLYDVYFNEYRESQARRWIQNAFQDAAWAHVRQFIDVGDLARMLATRIPSRVIREAARHLLTVVSHRGRNALIVDHFSVLDVPLSGLSIYCPWPRATARLTSRGARNVQVDRREYQGLKLAKGTRHDKNSYKQNANDKDMQAGDLGKQLGVTRCPCRSSPPVKCRCVGWVDFMYDPQAMQDAERRWVRQEARDRVGELEARVQHLGRIDDPKPAGRIDDPKPAGRIDDPKPAGRGDDPRSAGVDDHGAF
jgi:hypothetical protein